MDLGMGLEMGREWNRHSDKDEKGSGNRNGD